jgi:hypothetical protein
MRLLPLVLLCSCAILKPDPVNTPVGTIDIPATAAQTLAAGAGILDSLVLGDNAQAHPLLCGGLAGGAGVMRMGSVWFATDEPAPVGPLNVAWSVCDLDLTTVCKLGGTLNALASVADSAVVTPAGISAAAYTPPTCP